MNRIPLISEPDAAERGASSRRLKSYAKSRDSPP
jgi:hypothetical protein